MASLTEAILVSASLAETWETYFDRSRWRSWADGFDSVVSSDEYPERGGTLRWRSVPAGRGEVTERVVAHEPRRLHRVEFSDPYSEGELETGFRIEGGEDAQGAVATRVTQTLDYRLRRTGPFAGLTDLLFVRSQMRRSMQRSLGRFKHEVEEDL